MQFRIDAASGSLRISPSNLRKGDCAVMRQQQYVRYVRWSDEVGLDDLKSLWQKMMRILDGTNWDDSRVTAAVAVQLRKRSIGTDPNLRDVGQLMCIRIFPDMAHRARRLSSLH